MCVQEGYLLDLRETDPRYLWVPNGKQVNRLRRRNGSGICSDTRSRICILVPRLSVYVSFRFALRFWTFTHTPLSYDGTARHGQRRVNLQSIQIQAASMTSSFVTRRKMTFSSLLAPAHT